MASSSQEVPREITKEVESEQDELKIEVSVLQEHPEEKYAVDETSSQKKFSGQYQQIMKQSREGLNLQLLLHKHLMAIKGKPVGLMFN